MLSFRAAAPVLLLLAGCTPSNSPAPSVPEPVSFQRQDDNALLIPHPEFVNWNQFPVGTSIVREKKVTGSGDPLHVTTTLRLVEKSSAHVKVESQTTVVRPGQPPQENAPLEFRYAAQFALPRGLSPEFFTLPSLKARRIGEEPVQVGDQTYIATVFTWDEVNETGPMSVKYWQSQAAPGRFLQETIEGPNHASAERVAAVHQPAAEP